MVVSPPLLVGLGLGLAMYGTLIGAGGAIVLIPALILIYPQFRPETLTSISLAIVFINALSGTIAYSRQRRIDYKTGSLFALATVPGTIIGVLVTSLLSTKLFSLIFGIVVIVFSVFLMLRPQKGTSDRPLPNKGIRVLVDARGEEFTYSYNRNAGIAISFGVGFLAGLLGIGGGIVHVPVMIFLLGFPAHIATATSHFILVFTSLTGSLTHAFSGIYSEVWPLLMWLAIGVIPGAQMGAWLSRKLQGIQIVRFLAVGLSLMGIRLVILAL